MVVSDLGALWQASVILNCSRRGLVLGTVLILCNLTLFISSVLPSGDTPRVHLGHPGGRRQLVVAGLDLGLWS